MTLVSSTLVSNDEDNSCASFDECQKFDRGCPVGTYPNAHTKIKKSIYDIQFPAKWSEFGIIENDF